jgi:hypothetical protein
MRILSKLIPFRDSLGGNCKTIMIATISPEPAHTDESLSTCRYSFIKIYDYYLFL